MKKDHVKNPEKHQNPTTLPSPGQETSSPEANAVASSLTRDELIRQTAYSHFEARNHTHGHEVEDWLQAETKVGQMPGQRTETRELANQLT